MEKKYEFAIMVLTTYVMGIWEHADYGEVKKQVEDLVHNGMAKIAHEIGKKEMEKK